MNGLVSDGTKDHVRLSEAVSAGLQSLRGLATLSVLIHYALRLPENAPIGFFVSEYILSAHAAVVLFSVSSGYVLTLSLKRRGETLGAVLGFYAQRAFRIYPGLWMGVALGILCASSAFILADGAMSAWAKGLFLAENLTPLNAGLTLLGLSQSLLPPLWIIKVEIAGSIILPAIILLSGCWYGFILCFFALLVISFFAKTAVPLYMVQFRIDAGIALRIAEKAAAAFRTPWIFLTSAAMLCFFRYLMAWHYHHPLPSPVEEIAGAALICGIRFGNAQWLSNRHLVTLGDWSYGLCLFHLPLGVILFRLFSEADYFGFSADALAIIILAGTIIITLPLSAASYMWLELPLIKVGRAMTKSWTREK